MPPAGRHFASGAHLVCTSTLDVDFGKNVDAFAGGALFGGKVDNFLVGAGLLLAKLEVGWGGVRGGGCAGSVRRTVC